MSSQGHEKVNLTANERLNQQQKLKRMSESEMEKVRRRRWSEVHNQIRTEKEQKSVIKSDRPRTFPDVDFCNGSDKIVKVDEKAQLNSAKNNSKKVYESNKQKGRT
jgi:hypothetical protein